MLYLDESYANSKTYDGNTYKRGVTLNGVDYIVKLPKKDDTSVFAEYVASNFISNLGISCHKVLLANYTGNVMRLARDGSTDIKYYSGIVDLIEDFTNELYSLHSFGSFSQSSMDTGVDLETLGYSYDDILTVLNANKCLGVNKDAILRHFWRMYICDAILANRDRHQGNWGVLQNIVTGMYMPAPIYDNGGSLFPNIFNTINEMYGNTYQFFYDRIFTSPASLFQGYNKRLGKLGRTNYHDMFTSCSKSEIFNEELECIKQNVGLSGVLNALEQSLTDIPSDLALFYRVIILGRYLCIIEQQDNDDVFNSIIRGYFT